MKRSNDGYVFLLRPCVNILSMPELMHLKFWNLNFWIRLIFCSLKLASYAQHEVSKLFGNYRWNIGNTSTFLARRLESQIYGEPIWNWCLGHSKQLGRFWEGLGYHPRKIFWDGIYAKSYNLVHLWPDNYSNAVHNTFLITLTMGTSFSRVPLEMTFDASFLLLFVNVQATL